MVFLLGNSSLGILEFSASLRWNKATEAISSNSSLGNSRIPSTTSLKNLEFLNLEFLEIASVALLPRNDTENSRIPNLEFPNKNTP